MEVTINTRKVDPDIDVLELAGRMTLRRENGQIETAVRKLVAGGSSKIILDLSGVTYVDSSGVGAIAVSFTWAKEGNARLVASGAEGMVGEIFRLTRVDLLVPFFPDVSSAAASFNS